MKDPTEHYKAIVDRAEKRADGIIGRAEELTPTHSRNAPKLSHEEQRQDYLLAQSTPDGMRLRLREWRQAYGLKQAAEMFLEWDREFRDG